MQNKLRFLFRTIILLFAISLSANNMSTYGNQSSINQANGDATTNYNNKYYIQQKNLPEEKIGSKIAIRRIFLIPSFKFNDVAPITMDNALDYTNFFFEDADIYVEIQSICSSPLLITAAKIKILDAKNIKRSGYSSGGKNLLSEEITSNTDRKLLLFAPGEIKIIRLAQSFKFKGIMNFFNNNINENTKLLPRRPYGIYDLSLVQKLNIFMEKNYGKKASFKIIIFEKNYKPIIDAKIKLSQGGTLFDKTDIENNRYLIQYDSFIGEAINKIRNGEKDSFELFFLHDVSNISL